MSQRVRRFRGYQLSYRGDWLSGTVYAVINVASTRFKADKYIHICSCWAALDSVLVGACLIWSDLILSSDLSCPPNGMEGNQTAVGDDVLWHVPGSWIISSLFPSVSTVRTEWLKKKDYETFGMPSNSHVAELYFYFSTHYSASHALPRGGAITNKSRAWVGGCLVLWCVVVSFILDVRLLDVPDGVTQEEGHKGFLIHFPSAVRALIFLARRIQSLLSFVDREVEFWILCTNEIIVLQLLDVLFCFCQEKSQFVWLHRDSNSRPNVRRFRGYQLNHRGDRLVSSGDFKSSEGYANGGSLSRKLLAWLDVALLQYWFLTFRVLVANPKKLLDTVANPARGKKCGVNVDRSRNFCGYW